jgi:hypothetical protein
VGYNREQITRKNVIIYDYPQLSIVFWPWWRDFSCKIEAASPSRPVLR